MSLRSLEVQFTISNNKSMLLKKLIFQECSTYKAFICS